MIPLRLFELEIREGHIAPRWLGVDDEEWIGDVLVAVNRLAGQPLSALREAFGRGLLDLGRARGVTPRMLGAIALLERKRWSTHTRAAVPPETARDVLFELATRLPRADALREAGRLLDVSAEDVERSLFADRREARILQPPAIASTPADTIARYHEVLVRALLARSVEVTVTTTGELRPLAARAKRDGLVARFEAPDASGTARATISGALALFRDTVKYSSALARLVPIVTRAARWSLVARVSLPEGAALFSLDASTPAFTIPAEKRAPRDLLQTLATDLERLGWSLEPCSEVVSVGDQLFFPDAMLARGAQRALVEIVAARSPEHVAWTRGVLDGARVHVILCVDEGALRGLTPSHPAIVPFREIIDARRLVSECERARPRDSASPRPAGAPA